MKTKSAVLRVLYCADGHVIKTENRLHLIMYILSKETDICSDFDKTGQFPYSEDITDAVEELESHGLVNISINSTFGGQERKEFYLTDKGIKKSEKLISNNSTEQKIDEVVSKYGNYPVSNLVDQIRNSESFAEWT